MSIAIAAAGLPAQAGVNYCPIAAHMQKEAKAVQADKDCPGCAMTGKHEQKQNGCCDNGACIVKCSTIGVSASTIPTKIEIPNFTAIAVKFHRADGVLPSSLFQTQDRPPKHLS
jgi:hypothetical protein